MQLGLVTYQWGADWDLPTLIKNCQQTGFRGVELRTTHKHGVEPSLDSMARKEVARRFADSQVELVGLGTTCEFHAADPEVVKKNVEECKSFIRLCHDVGGSGVKVRPNGLPAGVPIEQHSRADRPLARRSGLVRRRLRRRDSPGNPWPRHVRKSPTFARSWTFRSTPAQSFVGIATTKTWPAPDWPANLNSVKERLGTIHIHDLISSYPWPELFDLLKKADFQGWTLLEEGSKTSDPIRVMKYYRLLWERMTA